MACGVVSQRQSRSATTPSTTVASAANQNQKQPGVIVSIACTICPLCVARAPHLPYNCEWGVGLLDLLLVRSTQPASDHTLLAGFPLPETPPVVRLRGLRGERVPRTG